MTRGIVLAALVVGVCGVGSRVEAQAPACKPVFDAMLKLTTTPHHAAATTDGGTVSESIVAGDSVYVKVRGAWRKSPITPQAQRQQEQENIQSAKVYTCQLLRSESVDGVPANVYKVHSETTDVGVSDGTLWVAPSTGLPLKTDQEFTTGGAKRHITMTWDYANIHAPI